MGRKSNMNITTVNWRYDNKRCKGSASTAANYQDGDSIGISDDTIDVRVLNPHCHIADPESAEVKRAHHKMNQAVTSSHMPPQRIISETMTGLTKGALVRLGKRESLCRQIQQRRWGVDRRQPSPVNCAFHIPADLCVCMEGNKKIDFVLYDSLVQHNEVRREGEADNPIIICGTDAALQVLTEASEWMMDATFMTTPALFFSC